MRFFWFGLCLLCFFLQGCTSPKMSQELERGKLNFAAGDFKTAFRGLLPVAANGNAQAQYAVGYMYYNGYGVAQDQTSGIFWMKRAANQGYRPAIKALNLIDHPPCEPPCQKSCPLPPRAAPIYKDEAEGRVLKPSYSPPPIKKTYSRLLNSPKEVRQPPAETAHYTVQLIGAYSVDDVRELQKDLKMGSTTRIGQTTFQGKPWYILTYGDFNSVSKAKLAMVNLPHPIKELGPWVRKSALIQRVT